METGILYFSRVPRDMRPNEIREYCTRFGEIFRQRFLAAQTNTKVAQMLKKRHGKSKVLQFKEGWIEFTTYQSAYEAASQMNAQPVEVKRRRRCSGEMWCVKCLPRGYRWEDLVTEREGEKRMRRMKIAAELQQEKEINEAYRQLAYKEIERQKQQLAAAQQQQQKRRNNQKQQQQQEEGEGEEEETNKTPQENQNQNQNAAVSQNAASQRKVAKKNSSSQQLQQQQQQQSSTSPSLSSSSTVKNVAAARPIKKMAAATTMSSNNNNNNNNNNVSQKRRTGSGGGGGEKKGSSKVLTADGYRDLWIS